MQHKPSPSGLPRYLAFARALLLGSSLAAVPVVATGCADDDAEPVADATPVDAGPTDGPVTVDGPLPPPDLPKSA